MTIEQLLSCSADQLEKLTDKQLEEYFKPYFTVTRPEQARLQPKTQQRKEPSPFSTPGRKNALAALASMGADMDLFNLKRRKK